MKNHNEKVSVIGLGVMGSAIARNLIKSGCDVTVWNRSPAKAEALKNDGGSAADSAASAIKASPVVIVCVDGYDASRSILSAVEAAQHLKGRTVVELSTGTPEDARNAEKWVLGNGADYLDGAIMATPSQIGRPDTTVLVSGGRDAFEQTEAMLRSIAGNLTYTGEPVGNASALDLAMLSAWFGGMVGFLHGARICEAESLPVDEFGTMVAALEPVIAEHDRLLSSDIHAGTYDAAENSIKICAAGLDDIARHAREAGINSDFPDFAAGLFNRAIEAGLGEEGPAAIIKLLRGSTAAAVSV